MSERVTPESQRGGEALDRHGDGADRDHQLLSLHSSRRARGMVRGGLPSPSPMVNVPSLLAALRRCWLVLLAAALVGLNAAIALSMLSPPAYSATTVLLLRHPSGSDPMRAIETDALLAHTRTIAGRAIEELGLDLSPQELVAEYQVLVLSQDLLQLRGTGPNGNEAVRRTSAIAEAFLAFRGEEVRRQGQLAIQALEERQEGLRAELSSIVDRINGLSATAGEDNDEVVKELGDLLTRRQAVSGQIGSLGQQIDVINLDTESVTGRSRVVDPAGEQPRSPVRTTIRNMVTGVLFGLIMGAGGIVFHAVTSDRLRRREDIMMALGAPVALSLGRLSGSPRAQRRRLRHHLESPSPGVSLLVHHLRQVLARSGTEKPAVVVVSLGSDGAAALGVAALATELAVEHDRVLLVDLSHSAALVQLLEVPPDPHARAGVAPSGASLDVICPSRGGRPASEDDQVDVQNLQLHDAADVVVVLATLDPAVGAEHLAEWAWTAVAVVTAGRSTATALGSTASMLASAGIDLDSAVLVGSDRGDETVGSQGRPASPAFEDSTLWANT